MSQFSLHLSNSVKYESIPLSYVTTFDVINMLTNRGEYKLILPDYIPESGLKIFIQFIKMLYEDSVLMLFDGTPIKLKLEAMEVVYLVAIFDYLGHNKKIKNILYLIDLKDDGIVFMTEIFKLINKSFNTTKIFTSKYNTFVQHDKSGSASSKFVDGENSYIRDNYTHIINTIDMLNLCPKKVLDGDVFPREAFKQPLISAIIESCVETNDIINYNRIMKLALHTYPRTCFLYLHSLEEDAALKNILEDILSIRTTSEYLHILTIPYPIYSTYVLYPQMLEINSPIKLKQKKKGKVIREEIKKIPALRPVYISLHSYSHSRDSQEWSYFYAQIDRTTKRVQVRGIIDKDNTYREVANTDFENTSEGEFVFKKDAIKEGQRVLFNLQL